MMVKLEEVGKRELKEDVAQLVRPIHVPMKRLPSNRRREKRRELL